MIVLISVEPRYKHNGSLDQRRGTFGFFPESESSFLFLLCREKDSKELAIKLHETDHSHRFDITLLQQTLLYFQAKNSEVFRKLYREVRPNACHIQKNMSLRIVKTYKLIYNILYIFEKIYQFI